MGMKGYLALERKKMALTLEILVRQTGLEKLPGCEVAGRNLRSIIEIAKGDTVPLNDRELMRIQELYGNTREVLRDAFDTFSDAEKRELLETYEGQWWFEEELGLADAAPRMRVGAMKR